MVVLDKAGKGNPYHDEHGEFASHDSSANHETVPLKAPRASASHSLQRLKKPIFDGTPQPIENPLNNQQVGHVGEYVAQTYLRQIQGEKDVQAANVDNPSFPVDLRYDHCLVEVKAGQVSNTIAAQKWRITTGGTGPAETAWLKTASPDDKARWNAHKQERALKRKEAVRRQFSKKAGVPYRAQTLTSILNPDKHTADLYLFDGWHQVIRWNSPEAEAAYVGTYRY